MNAETFGERIKRLRKELGLPLRVVAAEVDFDQSSLSKIERNEMVSPARIIRPLARVLKQDYQALQIKYLSERIFYEFNTSDYVLEALSIARQRLEKEHSGTQQVVERDKIITVLQNFFKDKPVEMAWLFGSFGRNEESFDSDIDILVRFQNPNPMDLFDYIGLTQELEDLTGRQIDLVEEGQLLQQAVPSVEQEKVLIYEKKAG